MGQVGEGARGGGGAMMWREPLQCFGCARVASPRLPTLSRSSACARQSFRRWKRPPDHKRTRNEPIGMVLKTDTNYVTAQEPFRSTIDAKIDQSSDLACFASSVLSIGKRSMLQSRPLSDSRKIRIAPALQKTGRQA